MKKIFGLLLLFVFVFTACTDDNEVVYIKKQIDEDVSEMRVHYLNLENGKCTFFELPNGECMMIDTGATEDFPVVYEYLKNLGIKTVDYIVITSNDSYHLGGAKKIIQNFKVQQIHVSKSIRNKKLYQSTADEAVANRCRIYTEEGGNEILTDKNLNITVAGPIYENYDDSADFSLSVMVSYGNTDFLSEGDCGSKSENDMLESIGKYLKSDVLSVPNSASGLTASSAFLQKVSPRYAVIQVFGGNSPQSTVLKTFEALGIYVLRTDVNGNIVITSNSKEIADIKTEG